MPTTSPATVEPVVEGGDGLPEGGRAVGLHVDEPLAQEVVRQLVPLIGSGFDSPAHHALDFRRSRVQEGQGISSRVCFSAALFPISTATADFIAFSGPQRTGLPVLIAPQNSAISFW